MSGLDFALKSMERELRCTVSISIYDKAFVATLKKSITAGAIVTRQPLFYGSESPELTFSRRMHFL